MPSVGGRRKGIEETVQQCLCLLARERHAQCAQHHLRPLGELQEQRVAATQLLEEGSTDARSRPRKLPQRLDLMRLQIIFVGKLELTPDQAGARFGQRDVEVPHALPLLIPLSDRRAAALQHEPLFIGG
jgi:hypothetical protein